MAQRLRALNALTEGPGSIPSTHMAAHPLTAGTGILMPSSGLKHIWDHTRCTYKHVGNIPKHIKQNK